MLLSSSKDPIETISLRGKTLQNPESFQVFCLDGAVTTAMFLFSYEEGENTHWKTVYSMLILRQANTGDSLTPWAQLMHSTLF